MNFDQLLQNKRQVTADWHAKQAEALLDCAKQSGSATALVYASFEVRMALERFVFEMSILAGGGDLSPEELGRASQKGGVFDLLSKKVDDYRKHLEFCNLISDINNHPIRIPIPDVRRFKRLITEINPYCHSQTDPANTVDDPERAWFTKGIAAVEEATTMLVELLRSQRGAIPRTTMPLEVRDLLDRYVSGECDLRTVRIRLEIMTPVLEARMRNKPG